MNWLIARLFRLGIRGSGRLAAIASGHNPFPLVRTRTAHGLTFWADPRSPIDVSVLRRGCFEPGVLACLRGLLQDGDVFWDVGANTGIHSISIKHLHPNVRVVAFEPSALNFTRLYLNTSANGLRLDLWCTPLAAERGFAALSIVDRGNSGLSSLRPWGDVAYDATLQCWCETADHLVTSGRAPSPTVVKVDVEGFELEVFSGMRGLLAGPTLRHIVFEGRGDLLDDNPSYPLAAMLRGHGFAISRIDASGYEWVASRGL